MDEKIVLNEFDLLGIIELNDISGIEKYVTPIIEKGVTVSYLSRSREYYNVKNMQELSEDREELKSLLSNKATKRNFVILENMLNCSAKVYFKKFEEYIKSSKSAEFGQDLIQAQKCLIEDSRALISLLDGNSADFSIINENILPNGKENCERRFIEMDNKAMLYMFCKSLKGLEINRQFEVLTPGYGSVYIGPFLKVMCGYNFTNMLKSKYIDETNSLESFTFSSLLSTDKICNSDVGVLLIDDNVGTGSTITEIKDILHNIGKKQVLAGAVQFNWRNYCRVSIGKKDDVDRFEPDDYDILTPINYAGHKLYEQAIDALTSKGEDYIKYLKSKGYRSEIYGDIVGAILRGITWANETKLELLETDYRQQNQGLNYNVLERYSNGPFTIHNLYAKKMLNSVYKNSQMLDCDLGEKTYIDNGDL